MRILLAPTLPGWAFDHRAKDLLALKYNNCIFDLKYLREINKKDQLLYDIIYPMTLDGAKILNKEIGIPLNKMAAGITSIRSLEKYMEDKSSFKPDFINFLRKLKGVNTASDELVNLLKPHVNVFKTRVGIDASFFKPNPKRKKNQTFTIGWVGRIDKPAHRSLKGFDLVLSAIKGLNVNLNIRTFKENYVPRKQMVKFYQSLDCFICSSQSEHIPLPILEAASCGVPIITTNVGIVPELITHMENGIIISRNTMDIRRKVVYLMNNPNLCEKLSHNIRKTILNAWTWDICKEDWENFFHSINNTIP
jgi:glycosyltransferase involved in cell wall biosynthesis